MHTPYLGVNDCGTLAGQVRTVQGKLWSNNNPASIFVGLLCEEDVRKSVSLLNAAKVTVNGFKRQQPKKEQGNVATYHFYISAVKIIVCLQISSP